MEGEEESLEIAAGDAAHDATPVDKQGATSQGMYNPNMCWRCGQVGQEIALTRTLSQLRY